MERVAGADRTATAARMSRRTFHRAGTVVLARADDHADALAASPLAAHLGGPLLLTAPDALSATTAVEIARLQAEAVILVGGPTALSRRLRADLERRGLSVRRIAGADRFATAAAIRAELPEAADVLVAAGWHPDAGRAWPDAVSAAGWAATEGLPVLLVTPDALPPATAAALRGATTCMSSAAPRR